MCAYVTMSTFTRMLSVGYACETTVTDLSVII